MIMVIEYGFGVPDPSYEKRGLFKFVNVITTFQLTQVTIRGKWSKILRICSGKM